MTSHVARHTSHHIPLTPGTSLTANMNNTIAVELYDHRTDEGDDFDAYDQVNLATDPAFAAAVKAGAAIVRAGWRAQLPSSLPPSGHQRSL